MACVLKRLVHLLELLTRCWELGFTVDYLKKPSGWRFPLCTTQFSTDQAEATTGLTSASDLVALQEMSPAQVLMFQLSLF